MYGEGTDHWEKDIYICLFGSRLHIKFKKMKVVKSFLVGLTIGILFAPQSGSKTRKRLKKVFKDYKDEAKDHLADAAGSVESKMHDTKKAIQNL